MQRAHVPLAMLYGPITIISDAIFKKSLLQIWEYGN